MPRKKSARVTMAMLSRARDLQAAGLSMSAIVRVLALDSGLELDQLPHPETLRHYLGPNGKPLSHVSHSNPSTFWGTESP